MMFAAASLAAVSLGTLMQDPGAIVDPTSLRPIAIELNGVASVATANTSLQIQDTLGQPVTASFTLVDPVPTPVEGDRVRIFFHAQLLFGGTIDRVQRTVTGLTTPTYHCECKDWSQILERRLLRRNFTSTTIQAILDSILDNELAGEPLTIGTIDSRATIPLVSADGARVFEVCRTMAGATGHTFYVEFDQSIQMRSTTAPVAPLVLDESVVVRQGATVKGDRETYRNVQTVIVTGTPATGTEALQVTVERSNPTQLAARQAIEAGTGRYESLEKVTHPTSNDAVELTLLGIGFANLRLATSGTLRHTVSCQVRGYGFRAGQIADVNVPTLGVAGTYVIQRVSIRDEQGRRLVHQLELTSSSAQQRAYESWLAIVQAGKVTVQIPAAITNNAQLFDTPGTTTWTVPPGVTTAEFTCVGGSGAGGGGTYISWPGLGGNPSVNWHHGGAGGPSGKAISIVSVVEGQVFDIVTGSAGTPGVSNQCINSCTNVSGTNGTAGTNSSVSRTGVVACQGNGGGFGGASNTTNDGLYNYGGFHGADGAPGSGVGDAVVGGGGELGGNRGTGSPFAQPTAGSDGYVEVRW
jgi:hypothetical protein